MNKFLKLALTVSLTSTSLTALLSPTIVSAQESPSVVNEVVVTTTRNETSRFDNVGSISTLDAGKTVNIFPVDLVNRTPGVQINRGSGQEHLTSIRSPILIGGAGAGSFLYLEDGISMRAPAFANINALLDAMPSPNGRVEVVRGPGSALYGSNALHGMINFVSGPIDKSQTTNRIAAGSYGRYALESEIDRVQEGYASRLGISLTGDEEGFRASQGFEQQKLRLQTQWEDNDTQYSFSLAGMNLNQETAGYVGTADDATREAYEDDVLSKSNDNTDAYRDARAYRSSLRMERSLDDGASLTLTPYLRSNEMEFRMHFLPGSASSTVEKNEHDSIGLLMNYHRQTANVTYDIGLDTDYTQGKLVEFQSGADKANFGVPTQIDYAQGLHYDFDVDALVLAPYLHAVWAWSEKTSVTTGLRVETTRYNYTNNTEDGLQGKLFRPADATDDFTDISPKLGLVHKLAENRRVFVNLARAARAPQVTDLYRLRDKGWDGVIEAIDEVESETLDSLEVGYRAAYANVSYEASVYVMQKKNHHFRDGNDYYESNGETRHRGVELEVVWDIDDALTLDANMTYANHEYAFDRNVAGANSLESITDGDDMDSAPKTLANATLTHQTSERLQSALTWQHVGEYFMDAANTDKYDGHDLLDVTLDYTLANEAVLQLQVQNILDEAYATRADKWFGDNRYFPGEGRRFMVALSTRY
ncbi:TonB-dependent receptor [Alphaproteobacteria bacterium]|nr:TonB-dependent receptor [Alphaproteobacteria bacterium]